jgi:hypothetical protein
MSEVRNATRISCHRRDDGSIVGEYEPSDRCTIKDIEDMVEDMLEAIDDNGETEYKDVQITPEVIVVEKIGQVTVFELLLSPKKWLRKLPTIGPDADEARAMKAQNRVGGWRI